LSGSELALAVDATTAALAGELAAQALTKPESEVPR
jgi:hypothetical protein